MKVSVIMPVYNAKPYIRQCLDSVIHQTLTDIEIICVDDGSTDGTRDILKEYAAADSRMRILTQQNLYPGVARNNGLTAAQGDYVIFWDSDDYFELNALEHLYQTAAEHDADICVCDAQDFDEATGLEISHQYLRKPHPEEAVFNIHTFSQYFFTFTAPVPWNKMIRRDLLLREGIQFQALQHVNDALAMFTALACADRIVLCKEKLIHYRSNRPDRLMTTYGERVDSVFLAYEQLKRDLERRGLLEDPVILSSFRNKIAGIYLFTMKFCNTYEQCREYYRQLREERFPFMGMENLPEGYILNAGNEEKYRKIMSVSVDDYLFWQYQKLNWDASGLRHDKSVLKTERKQLKEERKQLKAERKQLKADVKDLKNENRQLLIETETFKTKFKEKEAEEVKMVVQLESLQKAAQLKEARLKEYTALIETQKAELAEARGAHLLN